LKSLDLGPYRAPKCQPGTVSIKPKEQVTTVLVAPWTQGLAKAIKLVLEVGNVGSDETKKQRTFVLR